MDNNIGRRGNDQIQGNYLAAIAGRFERKLHIAAVIGIFHITMQVMHSQKRQEGNIIAQRFVFPVMFHHHRQFEQLVQFSITEQNGYQEK